MKEHLVQPATVLGIGELKELNYIREAAPGVRIGALTTLAELGRHPLLQKNYPLLADAAGHAATPQVRERATLGGNLCQRPRCWYFRNQEFHCLKKGGATCFAVDGENKYHAIFGDGPCHIVHPSNTAPALVALNAEFVARGSHGERVIKARDFFVVTDQNLKSENVLAPDEILTEIRLPAAPVQSATLELREKQSFDWPLVMASVAKLPDGWQVCLGAVAPRPWLSLSAMQVLGNQPITPELAVRAGEAAITGATPMHENQYKLQLVKVAVKRALLRAAGQEVS
jgi:xanthine dehydrogenase YagS FAD-binding subunit